MSDEEKQNDAPAVDTPDFSGEKMKMPESDVVNSDPEVKERSAFGLVIAILIGLLLVILSGLFYWYTLLVDQSVTIQETDSMRPTAEENNEPESTTAKAQAQSLNVVSTSDELSAIEADIESTNLESLDAELDAIDAELEAAMEAQ